MHAAHSVFGVMAVRTAMCIIMMGMMFMFPADSAKSARQALRLWGLDVVPSLFPYMVLCRMLSAQLCRYGIPVSMAAVGFGLLGGSPSGAAVLSGGGACASMRQMYALCALTGTISPMFLLSTVGKWMEDAGISGAMLLWAHVLGAGLCALIVRYCMRKKDWASPAHAGGGSRQNADPIGQSISAVFRVGGCIVFYSVVAGMVRHVPGMNALTISLAHAALEVSGGLHAIAELDLPPVWKATLLASASGFSGISILSQNLVFLRPLGIRMQSLVYIALLRSGCAAAAMLTLYIVLG